MDAVSVGACRLCGKRVEGLNVEELKALDAGHECRPADVLRLAVHFLGQLPGQVPQAVCVWLRDARGQAEDMASPDDFGICNEPGSVQQALDVARAVIAEEGL